MVMVPLQNFGKYGVVSDTLNSALPIGTWTDARNIRFSGIQMEKMLEPTMAYPFNVDTLETPLEEGETLGAPVWMQGWADGASTYAVIATQTKLYFLLRNSALDTGTWLDVTRTSGTYDPSGVWDSFAWGDTCIFNNGADAPQIFDQNELKFIDLPNWGLISTADDIANFGPPTRNMQATCKILKPYKNQLVAMGITEVGLYQPNTVWWSDITSLSTIDTTGVEGSGPPSWDYESPETASAKSEVGVGYGEITCAAQLNENMVIYTDNSATLMQFVGGSFIMSFRRLFNKGAAGQKCAVEFNNQHFVVSRDQIYLHDGSQVRLIAKDRVEEEFFRRLGKSGRFGGVDDIDWEGVQVTQNPDRKEISIIYNRVGDVHVPDVDDGGDPFVPPFVDAGGAYSGGVGAAGPIDGTVTPGTYPITGTLWTVVSGGTGTFGDATLIDTTFTPTSSGDIILRLTATPSIGAPVSDNTHFLADVLTPLVEHIYGGSVFTGFTDSHGTVIASPDGETIILNHTGNLSASIGALVYSIDGGGTFLSSGAFSGGSASIRSLQYDLVNDRWWAWLRNAGDGTLHYSTDDGATWTEFATVGTGGSGDFSSSFLLTDAGEIIYLRATTASGGSGGATRITIYDNPPVSSSYISSGNIDYNIHDSVPEIRGWRGYELMPGSGRVLMRADADNTTLGPQNPWFGYFFNTAFADGVDPEDGSLGLLFLDEKFVAVRGCAFNKDGNMIQWRSQVGSVTTFDSINHDYSGTSAFPTFTVDWEVPVKNVCMTYSTPLGGYVLSAEDVNDRGLLHLKHNIGVDFTAWTDLGDCRLTQFPSDYSPDVNSPNDDMRQLYWSHDNIYIYAYIYLGNGTTQDNLSQFDRITLNPPAAVPEEFRGVVLQNSFDLAKVLYDFPSDLPPDVLRATTLARNTDPANIKYGSGSMSYTTTTNGFATAEAPPLFNPYNFTLRFYYKANALPPGSGTHYDGLFHLGQFNQETDSLSMVVGTTGAISVRLHIDGRVQYQASTPAGMIVPGTYAEIEVEACWLTQRIYIYIDGVQQASIAFSRTSKYKGTRTMHLGYAYWSNSGVDALYSRGWIDEIQIVNEAIWEGASHAASTGPYT